MSGKNCKHEAALLFALENGEPVLGMLNNTVYEKQDVSELCNIVVDMDGDWVKSILASLVADNTGAADILAYVKDWDMLLSFFDTNPLNDKLIQYEDSLYGFSPERLIEVYRKRCLLLLPTEGLRKQRPSYRCFADNLKKLSSIGGRNEAIEIATYVKEKYPERMALLSLLQECGF